MPGACPVRSAWTVVVPGPEQQPFGRGEVVGVDPLLQDGDEHWRDWDTARSGLSLDPPMWPWGFGGGGICWSSCGSRCGSLCRGALM